MIGKLLRLGDNLKLREFKRIVGQINSIESVFAKMSDGELSSQREKFRQRYRDGETLEMLLPEAFATVREVAKRSIDQRHFDVQIEAGIALNEGAIAEVKTGEGKTLISTLPAYLNSLSGSVHIATVNNYLAQRDEKWMRSIYQRLDVSTGVILQEQSHEAKQAAYAADVVYGVNTEFGFDYLRDNMAVDASQRITKQRRDFILLDEVDLTLIDNSRTPLIISQPNQSPSELYKLAKNVAEQLKEKISYTVDRKKKSIYLTETGIEEIERILDIEELYAIEEASKYIYYIINALHAKELYRVDRDYIIQSDNVVIIDEYTGRILHGRRYQEGIHQALETKHEVEVREESSILSSITIQNFVKLYKRVAGMTGTAMSEAREFQETYSLPVYKIPTNKKVIRKDHGDIIFLKEHIKYQRIVSLIEEKHKRGQPVLVGTPSIEKSEYLSTLLEEKQIKHKILNAKNHEKEAEIISDAGKLYSVIISTNMAGRGTDITLGGNVSHIAHRRLKAKYGDIETIERKLYNRELYAELKRAAESIQEEQKQLKKLGGLCVIGSERHEARRIDEQLRGRTGRQGDEGESHFFISLEDKLLRSFSNDGIIRFFLNNNSLDENINVQSKLLDRAIESAQLSIEHYNAEARKNLYKYDSVLNKHRLAFYEMRDHILEMEYPKEKELFTGVIISCICEVIDAYISPSRKRNIDRNTISTLMDKLDNQLDIQVERNELGAILKKNPSKEERYLEIKSRIVEMALERFKRSLGNFSEEAIYRVLKQILLYSADFLWRTHIQIMSDIQSSVALRAIGQKDPIVEYKREGNLLYKEMVNEIRRLFVLQSLNIRDYEIEENGSINLLIMEKEKTV